MMSEDMEEETDSFKYHIKPETLVVGVSPSLFSPHQDVKSFMSSSPSFALGPCLIFSPVLLYLLEAIRTTAVQSILKPLPSNHKAYHATAHLHTSPPHPGLAASDVNERQTSVVAMSETDSGLKRKSLGEAETGDATKKTKLSFAVGLKKPSGPGLDKKDAGKPKIKIAPVSIKLGAAKPKEPEKKVVAPSRTVAKVFGDSSDEEEEDMPPEAKMRMKNIGRNTKTSAGPNSFNKGRLGFTSPTAKWKMPNLKNEAETLREPSEKESS